MFNNPEIGQTNFEPAANGQALAADNQSSAFGLPENDIHAMPEQFLQGAPLEAKSSGKAKWIILGTGIFLFLGALIAGAFYFINQQAKQTATLQPAANSQQNNANQNQPAQTDENKTSTLKEEEPVLNTSAIRDLTRIADMSSIQSALSVYYQTNSVFPGSLSDLVDRFLEKVPQNPTPGGQDYVYSAINERQNYTVGFALESGGMWGVAKLPAGQYNLKPEGVMPLASSQSGAEDQTGAKTQFPESPAFVPGEGLDSDGDGLTDIEENIYKTDSAKTDSDEDGYADSAEILNFYDPTKAGGRLMDSGLISVHRNETEGFSLLFPAAWVSRELNGGETIFTSNTGEFVSVSVQENPASQSAFNWYMSKFPGAKTSELKSLIIDGIPAIGSPDGLSAYLAIGAKVYVITYNIGAQQQTNFKTTYQLFLKSFMFVAAGE